MPPDRSIRRGGQGRVVVRRRGDQRSATRAGVGRMVEDEASGRRRYEGLGFHDLRRANATGLVAEGVDVKTAQAMLGHSESRLTLDVYAQAVAVMGEAAAAAMGARFLGPASRDGVGFRRWGQVSAVAAPAL